MISCAVRRSNTLAAFTLMEVIVATVTGAVVVVACLEALSVAVSSADAVSARAQATEERIVTLGAIADDLATVSPGSFTGRDPASLEAGEEVFLDFLRMARRPGGPSSTGREGARFCRERVTYRLDRTAEGADSKWILRIVRRQLEGGEEETVHRMPRSSLGSLSFYDGVAWSERCEGRRPPLAVKVTAAPDATGAERSLSLVVGLR